MKYVLIDRYLELEKGKFGRAVKTITHGEDFLEYQISPFPSMPAGMLIEAQAQTAGVLVNATYDFRGKTLLAKIEKAEFYRPVTVGEQLFITARMRDVRGQSCALETEVEVEGSIVARMSSLYAVLELTGAEGRLFDMPKFYAKRADLMRVLGVLSLLGVDAGSLIAAGAAGVAVDPGSRTRPASIASPTDNPADPSGSPDRP